MERFDERLESEGIKISDVSVVIDVICLVIRNMSSYYRIIVEGQKSILLFYFIVGVESKWENI